MDQHWGPSAIASLILLQVTSSVSGSTRVSPMTPTEVRIRHPARQGVHVDVPRNPARPRPSRCSSRCSTRQAVQIPQNGLQLCRKSHHFLSGVPGSLRSSSRVLVGNDHDVSRSIRKRIQDDEAMSPRWTMRPFRHLWPWAGRRRRSPVGFSVRGDIGVAPRSPEIIHATAG